MSSDAEERIRGKAETALRFAFPDARIVHELVVKQGSCRIDLAAITPTRLILVEVKSEKDVLDRLERQLIQGRSVSDAMIVVVAEKHLEKAQKLAGYSNTVGEDAVSMTLNRLHRLIMESTTNSPARLRMLWASELRAIASAKSTATRDYCIRAASDDLPGRDVRRMVCEALRAREFPRADPPILSDLFQRPTRFIG